MTATGRDDSPLCQHDLPSAQIAEDMTSMDRLRHDPGNTAPPAMAPRVIIRSHQLILRILVSWADQVMPG